MITISLTKEEAKEVLNTLAAACDIAMQSTLFAIADGEIADAKTELEIYSTLTDVRNRILANLISD